MMTQLIEKLESHMTKFIDNVQIHEKPFVHFKGQGIFTDEVYESLLNSFPDDGFKFTSTEGYANRGTKKFDLSELTKINPMWEVLFKGITSKKFIRSLGKRLGKKLYKERGLRVLLPWVIKENNSNIFSLKLRAEVSIDSIGKRGKINPHRDASRKLITIMFYFPDEDWKKNWGGDTIFYQIKSQDKKKKFYKTKWRKFNNVSLDNLPEFYDVFEEFSKGDFIRNSISGLCANPLSYHSVNPIEIDDKRRRKTVRLCLELDKSYTFLNKLTEKVISLLNKF
jgi:hypothetical protein